MNTYKMILEYDGTEFAGWQYQTNGRSVQGEVETGLARITGEKIRIVGAGRTDAGVHARGQVSSFRSGTRMQPARMTHGMNGVLPPDVAVLRTEIAPPGFHARFDATARHYSYRIIRRPSALLRKYAWHVGYSLDSSLLATCARQIVGERDFRPFCKEGSAVSNYLCRVTRAEWIEEGEVLAFHIVANRFLYGMVRALIGSMVDVARGKKPVDDFLRMLQSPGRSRSAPSAPALGLVLEQVDYERNSAFKQYQVEPEYSIIHEEEE